MANLKYYDSGSEAWETLVIGKQGPSGPAGPAGPGVISSATAPTDTSVIWYNTENGNAYTYYDGFWTSISGLPSIPVGGTTGQVLAKSSNTDYATQWVAPSALTLIRKTDFSAVSSLSLNDIFSADYENYRVIVTTSSSSADIQLQFRLRVAGADNTSSTYKYGGYDVGAFGGEGARFIGSTTDTFFYAGFSNSTNGSAFEALVSSPFTSKVTKITSVGAGHRTSVLGGGFAATTSFTGLTLLTNTGNITGSIWVYALKDS